MKKSIQSTAEKILHAAEEIFMEKGFEGSSINDIAGKAKIHKSLIYHHFGNKENLWRSVKKNLLESHAGKDISQLDFSMVSFESFLESFVSLRFTFYDKNPIIARLVTWQMLEDTKDDLKGIGSPKLNSISSQIKEFQRRGEVRADLEPEMVSYWIMKSTSIPFLDKPGFFQGKEASKNKQIYLKMIIKGLYLALSTQISNKAPNKPKIYSV